MFHERTFSAGASVMTADQPGESIYIFLEGSVKVHLSLPGGAEVMLAVSGPGEVVGEMSLADSLGRSANVSTLEESALLWVDRRTLRSNVGESPVLAHNLTSHRLHVRQQWQQRGSNRR